MTGIRLERRSTPDRLRYLAGKLREGEDRWISAVALSLDAMAGEMEGEAVALRGTDYFLDQIAGSLTAHAEQPYEVRDIAESLRRKAAAIRRERTGR